MSELSTISRHAITVLAGQLAVMAFGVTDTIVAGRHGEASLAALSVGSAIFISVYVALIGVLQALLPVWAELRGARQTDSLGRSLRQSLYLCGAASLVGMAILLSPAPLLRWTEVPPALRTEVESYLAVLALASSCHCRSGSPLAAQGCLRKAWWDARGPPWWSTAACLRWPSGCCARRTSMNPCASGAVWSPRTGPPLRALPAWASRPVWL